MSGDVHANGAGGSRPLPPAFTQPPRRTLEAGAGADRPRPPFFRTTAGDEAWAREHAQPTGGYSSDFAGPEPTDGDSGYDAPPPAGLEPAAALQLEQPTETPTESSAPAGFEVADFEPPAEEGSTAPAGLEVAIFEPPAAEAEFVAPAGFEPDTLQPPESAPTPQAFQPTTAADAAISSDITVSEPAPVAGEDRTRTKGYAGLPSDAVFLPDAVLPRRPTREEEVLPDFLEPMRRPATAASNPAILVAARLELLARRLREHGGAGLTESFSGDTLDLALAGFISGYLAGRGS